MFWWILLGILFLLVVFLFTPLGFSLVYDASGFHLLLLAGWIRIPVNFAKIWEWIQKLIDAAQKETPKKEKKPQEPKPPKEPKPKEPAKGGPWTDFLPLLKRIPEVLDDLRRKIRLRRLQLHLVLAGDDPFDVAMAYNAAWATVGNALPLLERCFVIQKKDISVDCDYMAEKTLVTARLDITMTPARMLALVLRFVFRVVRQLIQIINSRKGGATP